MPVLFDIGANRGDATLAGIQQGFTVIAVEPAPRVFGELVKQFIYSQVRPLKYAVSDTNNEQIEFYEATEDGLSTINKDWLTDSKLPYAGKEFRTITATTITIDRLCEIYGEPNLIKIDVEGAEWNVFRGMTKYYGELTFEWTQATLDEHQEQLAYLASLGYTKVAPQFIVHHLQRPETWYDIDIDLTTWRNEHAPFWESHEWTIAGLRPTSDAGMIWVK